MNEEKKKIMKELIDRYEQLEMKCNEEVKEYIKKLEKKLKELL